MDPADGGVLIARGPMLTSGPHGDPVDRPSGGGTSAADCWEGMRKAEQIHKLPLDDRNITKSVSLIAFWICNKAKVRLPNVSQHFKTLKY